MNEDTSAKVNVATRIERSTLERAERVAKADHRTLANVLEICVLRYLPELEKEVLGEEFVGKPLPGKRKAAA